MLQAIDDACLYGIASVEVHTVTRPLQSGLSSPNCPPFWLARVPIKTWIPPGMPRQPQMRRRPSRARLIHFEAFGRHDLDETM